MAIKVLAPGLATTVQDLGRPGYYHLGIPISGAMDRYALRAANLLVGNDEGAAALEAVFLGPELEFPRDAMVAVAGAELAATPEIWHEIYASYGTAGASTFIAGGAQLITNGWGLPINISTTLLATMVVLFAGTTMDSGVRLQRYIIQEWGDIYGIPALKSGVVATLTAVACCLLLAFGATSGSSGAGGLKIWPLFGSTNQILAGLTLLVISVILIKKRRPARYTLIPMVFILITSIWAAVLKLIEFYREGNWLLVTIDVVVLIASVMVTLEAASVISRIRQENRHCSPE